MFERTKLGDSLDILSKIIMIPPHIWGSKEYSLEFASDYVIHAG